MKSAAKKGIVVPRKETPSTWIALALFVLTVAAFWPSLRHGFIGSLDDGRYVTNNAWVKQGLSFPGLVCALTTPVASNWHPLTMLTHMVDVQIYGLDPWGHHLTNILLHACATALLFVLLRTLTGRAWPSALVASLFGLHPMHVESVAWVAERKDVLSACLWFLTTLAYARYARAPSRQRYWAVAGLYVLGLMAKPMLVTLPFTLLLLDYWPLERVPRNLFTRQAAPAVIGLVREKLPLFTLAASASAVTFLVQRSGGSVDEVLPFGVRVGNALVSYVAYAVKLCSVSGFAVYYPYPASALPLWEIVGALFVLAAVTGAVLWWAPRWPYLAVGWLWYLGTLLPVIGLVQVGSQAMADRYSYIPSVGLFVLAVWGLSEVTERMDFGRTLAAAAAGLVLVALILSMRLQLGYWRDEESLYRHAIAVTGDNLLVRHNLGTVLMNQGRFDEAKEQFLECIRMAPENARSYYCLGLVYGELGEQANALECFRRADDLGTGSGSASYQAGLAFAKLGRTDEAARAFKQAIQKYEEAVRRDPESAAAHFDLAVVLERMGKPEEAWRHYEKALRLKPDILPAREAELLRDKLGGG